MPEYLNSINSNSVKTFAFRHIFAKKKVVNLINKLVKFNVKVTYVDWENEKRDIAEIGSEEFEEIVMSGSVKSFTFADEVKERLFK